ncbi:hypothetical protein MKY96_32590 [Paenibacillus sp. FSL R7-0302]|uniref:hypothetical protein n=1 Tax=Paenibacillus sp. FSL R7-0302 TaxID=2921681 RepID=UPI0030F54167
MSNVILFEKFKEGRSTLAEMCEEITEGLFPFVTFRVFVGSSMASCVTIPWCRFRPYQNAFWEVRSCDCGGTYCGHPTQTLYMEKSSTKEYVFSKVQDGVYFFDMNVKG